MGTGEQADNSDSVVTIVQPADPQTAKATLLTALANMMATVQEQDTGKNPRLQAARDLCRALDTKALAEAAEVPVLKATLATIEQAKGLGLDISPLQAAAGAQLESVKRTTAAWQEYLTAVGIADDLQTKLSNGDLGTLLLDDLTTAVDCFNTLAAHHKCARPTAKSTGRKKSADGEVGKGSKKSAKTVMTALGFSAEEVARPDGTTSKKGKSWRFAVGDEAKLKAAGITTEQAEVITSQVWTPGADAVTYLGRGELLG